MILLFTFTFTLSPIEVFIPSVIHPRRHGQDSSDLEGSHREADCGMVRLQTSIEAGRQDCFRSPP